MQKNPVGQFHAKSASFFWAISKVNLLVLNKLVRPHLANFDLGKSFWPLVGFLASKAPKISNKPVAYFFSDSAGLFASKVMNRFIFDDGASKRS